MLNQNKAAYFAFYLPDQAAWDRYHDFWRYSPEDVLWVQDLECGQAYGDDGGGHAVVLVGYNDEDPNPDNHYWVFLNSWGTASGMRPNGLFRMKMDMDYDCRYVYEDRDFSAVYWQTIDVQFSQNPTECAYSVNPATESFNSSGGGGVIHVTASASGCTWAAISNASWIVLDPSSSGTGSGAVLYRIPANSGKERTGTLTVAGKAVTIAQEGSLLSTNILNNPGFENGNDGSWTGQTWLIWKIPCFAQTGHECAYQGEWVASLGGWLDADNYLYQDFTIPSFAKNATLRFWYAINAATNILVDEPFDELEVGIYRADDYYYKNIITLSNVDQTSDWAQTGSLDVSEFIGQDVSLGFRCDNSPFSDTDFLIDDVELLIDTDAYFPENGIWKNTAEGISLYLQKYQTGSVVVVIMVNNVLTAFLDPAYRDGIECKNDLMLQGRELSLTVDKSSAGSLTVKVPGKSGTYPVSLAFPDDGSTDYYTPTNAIWESSDSKLKFYLQKYETSSCVIITLAAGKLTAFLDDEFLDVVQCTQDVLGNAHSIRLEVNPGTGSGFMTVDLPGLSGTYRVSFKFPENS